MSEISKFEIRKLHGRKDINLSIQDNTLILVGENGTGKSTVLQLLYYLLSGQWVSLLKYQFHSLSIEIGGKKHTLKHDSIMQMSDRISLKALRRLPHRSARTIHESMERNGFLSNSQLEQLAFEFDIPMKYLIEELSDNYDLFDRKGKTKGQEELRSLLKDIREAMGSQILFLPTYRRIEQELQDIFKGVDDREFSKRSMMSRGAEGVDSYMELVEFGMKDVEDSIKRKVSQLESFARNELNELTISYLGNIVEQEYSSIDFKMIKDMEAKDIDNILNRIQERILTIEKKEHLKEIISKVKSDKQTSDHDKIVSHYFTKLMAFHRELEVREERIVSFCNVCNEYMSNKTFTYSSSSYQFSIAENYGDQQQEIKLHQLSSGEKQIVSLFSHLYLSGGSEKYFVMIDEPELSLSVPWQRRFLKDIREADFCSGLIAVTHSPFIYENGLKVYAHGLGEFID